MKGDDSELLTAPTLTTRCRVCERPFGETAVFCGGCGVRLRPDGAEVIEEHIPAADPLIGRVVAERYELLEQVGRGGMGVVYRAQHAHIGKMMAMKLLHGELARNRNTLKRFRREAEAVSRLTHPNTVQLFDYGRDGDLVYLVMEFLSGVDLGAMVKRTGGLSFRFVAGLMEQVAASVAEAHSRGIIHRDLKPENIMVLDARSAKPRAKVLDFGLAKLRNSDGISHVSITRAGAVVGTPYYMSPEQIRGAEVDGRSDVYALGAVMYRAVTGVPPFRAESPMSVLSKHLNEPLEPPSKLLGDALEPEGDAIITRALAKDPGARFQSMADMRNALLDYLVSVGDRVDDSSSGRRSFAASSAGKNSAQEIRSQLERYERRLRRRGLAINLMLALLLGAAVVAGVFYWDGSLATRLSIDEIEPNDRPDNATPLSEGSERRGFIGQRLSKQAGDQDLYRIENTETRTRPIRVSITGIPNMDINLSIYRSGIRQALISSNGQPQGEGEEIVGFPLNSANYFIGVRDQWVLGELPTENISDEYHVTWSFMPPDSQREQEYNDTLEQAENLEVGRARTGHIGWEGDQDVFCVLGALDAGQVHLSGVPRLDLRLKVIDRETGRARSVNESGVNEGETTPVLRDLESGQTCFEVSIEPDGGRFLSSGEPYRIELRDAEAGPAEAGEASNESE